MEDPEIRILLCFTQYLFTTFLVSKLSEQSRIISESFSRCLMFAESTFSSNPVSSTKGFNWDNFFTEVMALFFDKSFSSKRICLCKFDASTKSKSIILILPNPDRAE